MLEVYAGIIVGVRFVACPTAKCRGTPVLPVRGHCVLVVYQSEPIFFIVHLHTAYSVTCLEVKTRLILKAIYLFINNKRAKSHLHCYEQIGFSFVMHAKITTNKNGVGGAIHANNRPTFKKIENVKEHET